MKEGTAGAEEDLVDLLEVSRVVRVGDVWWQPLSVQRALWVVFPHHVELALGVAAPDLAEELAKVVPIHGEDEVGSAVVLGAPVA